MSGIYRTPAGQRAVEQRYREHLDNWPVPAEHRTVPTRHGDTFVTVCGPQQASPVVLLHGAGTDSTIWLAEAERWSKTHRVHLVDVIGEPGLSAPSRPPLQSGAYAEWLDDVLDALGISHAAFVGASLGGWLALDYTIRRPHRVDRLVLRAPGGIGRQKYGAVLASAFLLALGQRGRRSAVRLILGPSPDLGDFIDYMALTQQHYRPRRDRLPVFTDEQLRTVQTPTLVVLGARDRILDSRDTARRVKRLLPDASLTVVPEAGHALVDDGSSIDEFLTGSARR
ncbi:alpha/beta fold hydrolase [Mycobacterium sp. NAZ190054]|uniref:alpha/beta fold hydrolase n=1 Tax=Mycobacterium sp. NAZ190054 TaxID=1747766 RepID=UPI00079B65DB|nr:alpha/beta hydrolase [Mycobacterium sp. NAZ190054]KWX67483.1 alpha/beta hydrolase [Mycobacterium sp. NAZ190054]